MYKYATLNREFENSKKITNLMREDAVLRNITVLKNFGFSITKFSFYTIKNSFSSCNTYITEFVP